MSLNFQTTLNGKNYKGTININEPYIYKKDGTKYSP